MCDCFEKTLEKISEKVRENIPENATEYKCDWKDRVLRFDGGLGVGLYIEHEHRNIKKDGTPYASMKKQSNFVALSFCPFCGTKIQKKEKDAN